MIFSSRNYAVGMAHYQITGGTKALGLMIVGYLMLVGLVFGMVIFNNNPRDLPMVFAVMYTVFFSLQALAMVAAGGGRISSCIRADTASNMIESHRLMPVSAPRIVLSYLFGTTSQLAVLLAIHALILLGLAGVAGVPLASFVIGQMVLAFFAVFAWTLMAMAAFMFRQALALMILGGVFAGIASAILRQIGILPALTLLSTPFLGETIFSISGGAISLRDTYAVAILAQAAFGTLFFIGACRRYRGMYLTTFNFAMGMALVGLWGIDSLVSMGVWKSLFERRGIEFSSQPSPEAQIVAAIAVGALLVIVPIHALATWEANHPLPANRRWLALAAVVLAAVVPMGWIFAPVPWLLTLIVVGLHVLTLYGAFRFTRNMSALSVGVFVILIFVLIWAAPLFIELLRLSMLSGEDYQRNGNSLSMISTISPLGFLMAAWRTGSGEPPPVVLGLVAQAGFCGLVWWMVGRRKPAVIKAPLQPAST